MKKFTHPIPEYAGEYGRGDVGSPVTSLVISVVRSPVTSFATSLVESPETYLLLTQNSANFLPEYAEDEGRAVESLGYACRHTKRGRRQKKRMKDIFDNSLVFIKTGVVRIELIQGKISFISYIVSGLTSFFQLLIEIERYEQYIC